MYGSDKSGLSDPYAKVCINRYSFTTRIVKESVSPTWDQTILISQIKMYGEQSTVDDSPPPVVLEFYDKDIVVSCLWHYNKGHCLQFFLYAGLNWVLIW